jgi:hypothetical protein
VGTLRQLRGGDRMNLRQLVVYRVHLIGSDQRCGTQWIGHGGLILLAAPLLSHLSFEKMKSKPLYVCPGCSNHTYTNNMINRYNISLNYKVKSYKMTHGPKRKITDKCRILSVGAASTGITSGEAGLASFIFILLVHLISTPTFSLK